MPPTKTGTWRSIVVPSPTWPSALLPQHFTDASAITAQECDSPTPRLTTFVASESPVIPDTRTGVELSVVESLPNCPEKFEPQQRTVPFAITAQV